MCFFSLGVGFQVGWCSFSFDLMVGAENPDLDASPETKRAFLGCGFKFQLFVFLIPTWGNDPI